MSKEHDIRYTKVVIGHCDLFLLPSFMKDGFIYKFIYSFHMPLFMLLSGYLSMPNKYFPLVCRDVVTGGRKSE